MLLMPVSIDHREEFSISFDRFLSVDFFVLNVLHQHQKLLSNAALWWCPVSMSCPSPSLQGKTFLAEEVVKINEMGDKCLLASYL